MATDRAAVVAFWREHPNHSAAQVAEHFGGDVKPATLRQWRKRYVAPALPKVPEQSALALAPARDLDPALEAKREAELAELGLTPAEVSSDDLVDQVEFEQERASRIVKFLRLGVPRGVAARRTGTNERTYYKWWARGRREASGPYRDFYDQVEEALAEAETRLIGHIRKAAQSEWRAARYLLESRYPSRWRNTRVLEQGPTGSVGEGDGRGVNVEVNVTATAAGLQLASLSLEQLSALTGRRLETAPVVVVEPEKP